MTQKNCPNKHLHSRHVPHHPLTLVLVSHSCPPFSPPTMESPDGSSTGACAGEDSQESMTLLNAMNPLPDSQSQPRSPSSRESPIVKVQLLSRPKDSMDSDLNAGFSYAPRVKINPGQYNRRLPSNPINTVSEERPNDRQDWLTDFQHTNKPTICTNPARPAVFSAELSTAGT